jgi:uncharacterized protein
VVTGEVTIAARDATVEGITINAGDWLGLADDKPVAAEDDFEDVAFAVVDRLLRGSRSLLTVLAGADAPPLDDLLARVAAAHPEVEVDVQEGGQPHYHLLLSAE